MIKTIKRLQSLLLLLVILLVVVGLFWVIKDIFISQSGTTESKDFVISSGESVGQITDNLIASDLLENSLIFKAYLKLRGLDSKIKVGTHSLPGNLSISALTNALVSGNTITNEKTITIKEGWNLRDIAHYLSTEGFGRTEAFYRLSGYPAFDYRQENDLPALPKFFSNYSFLKDKPSYVSIEGYLFPDTYRVFKDATMQDIIMKLVDNFGNKLDNDLRAEIEKQGKSIFEIITMASIIEKESDSVDNMAKIAGVYYNRLNAPMRLQSDPTVNYVTLNNTDRPTYEDLEVDSAYNTYRNDGLPLGPICNPSLAAIKAAIYPEAHDYYFFLNTSEGELIFAKTFEEHKANREKYLGN